MIIADPITNTPTVSPAESSGGSPAPGRDAAGTQGAGAQGCAETKRVSLYAMAVEGLLVPGPTGLREGIARARLGAWPELELIVNCGEQVAYQVYLHGRDVIESIADARAYRLALGAASQRFSGIHLDTLARDGVSLLHIAEIRMGIRTRNGDLRREWN